MRIIERDVDPSSVNVEFYLPGRDVDWIYVGTLKLPKLNRIANEFIESLRNLSVVDFSRIRYLKVTKSEK